MIEQQARTDGTARFSVGNIEVINLPGGNIFITEKNLGYTDACYMTGHLPSEKLRTSPEHWDALYANKLSRELIATAWNKANRPGLFEFTHNLAEMRKTGLKIASLGAGPGADTANLAMLPGVEKIYGVDFSQEACARAGEIISDANLSNAEMVNKTNIQFLEGVKDNEFDFILIYGGLIENTSDVATIRRTLELAAKRLKPGGVLWGVGLNQPALKGADYNPLVALDILGEFPHATGTFQGLLNDVAEMTGVQAITGVKSETHPLEPGGEPVIHSHTVERLIAAKALTADVKIPLAGFSSAISPEWADTYKEIIGDRIEKVTKPLL